MPDSAGLSYVITGCAGSGTGWASAVMSKLGSRCGHESVYGFRYKRAIPGREGDSAWEAIGRLPDDIPVVLLVRHPLRVIRSEFALRYFLIDAPSHLYVRNNRYVRRMRPDITDAPDRFTRIVRYAATWDDDVAEMPNVRVLRVEDANAHDLRSMFSYLTGRDTSVDRCRRVLSAMGTSYNAHGGAKSSVSWADITTHPDGAAVVAKARRHGYTVES